MSNDYLHIGMTPEGWFFSPGRAAVLVFGPPGSGKTTACLVCQALLAQGPAVIVTTKGDDIYWPTAQTRARLAANGGELWHYSPGEGETLPGLVELRWSLITGARNWDTARRTTEAITGETLEADSGVENDSGRFFKVGSGQLIAPLLHAADLGDSDMHFVSDGVAEDPRVLAEVERRLVRAESRFALRMFGGVMRADPRTRSNIFSTASQVFDVYQRDCTFNSTVSPNFDPKAFARSTGTIYVTATRREQKTLSPLIVHLLSEIQREMEALFEEEKHSRYRHPPMYWALDELASMARIKEFPSLVSQSGSTGLHIAACVQDLSQAKAIWKDEGENLMTIMATVVFPGIANKDMLDNISTMGGMTWLEKWNESFTEGISKGTSESWNKDGQTQGTNETENSSTTNTSSWHHVNRMDGGDIYRGNAGIGHEADADDRMIYMYGGVILGCQAMPYYKSPPFRELIIANALYAGENFKGDWAELPIPEVSLDGLSQEWLKRYKRALELRNGPRGELEAS